jgi:hypothetical protein
MIYVSVFFVLLRKTKKNTHMIRCVARGCATGYFDTI